MNLHQYAETREVTSQVPSLDGANSTASTCLSRSGCVAGGGWAEERLQRRRAGRRPADGAGFWPTSASRSSIAARQRNASTWWSSTPPTS